MWTLDPTDRNAPARRTAAFVDQFVRRGRGLAALVEYLRAHLDARAPGSSTTFGEHLVDLLALGLRWRAHARATLRRPAARPEHESVVALLSRLRADGLPAAEVARMRAWSEFSVDESCPEALDEACELAAWFELAADAAIGLDAPGLEAQLSLVRAEVLSRALRERRLNAPLPRLAPRAPRQAAPALPLRSAAGRARHLS